MPVSRRRICLWGMCSQPCIGPVTRNIMEMNCKQKDMVLYWCGKSATRFVSIVSTTSQVLKRTRAAKLASWSTELTKDLLQYLEQDSNYKTPQEFQTLFVDVYSEAFMDRIRHFMKLEKFDSNLELIQMALAEVKQGTRHLPPSCPMGESTEASWRESFSVKTRQWSHTHELVVIFWDAPFQHMNLWNTGATV